MQETDNHPCVSWNEPFPVVGQVVVCFFLTSNLRQCKESDIVEKIPNKQIQVNLKLNEKLK